MAHEGCALLLAWALPQLGLRWSGYDRLRRRVCKRLARRIRELKLADADAYRQFLETHPDEWARLDALCRMPISRFQRDAYVYEALQNMVIPELAERALARGDTVLRCWSAGCASGEEPYTLSILWRLALAHRFPALSLQVLASDSDEGFLARARAGVYVPGSLKEEPAEWRAAAFEPVPEGLRVRDAFRAGITFELRDLRRSWPDGPFDLVLCRNVVLTYFADALQPEAMARIHERLVPGGALAVGKGERLPEGMGGFKPWDGLPMIYRRS